MKNTPKSIEIRQAFETFAVNNKGKTKLTTKEINEGAKQFMGDNSLHGWCVSDFAEPETNHSRSKNNKPLFKREKTWFLYCFIVVYTINTYSNWFFHTSHFKGTTSKSATEISRRAYIY